LAGLLLVGIIAGCMSLSFGEKSVTYAPVPSDGVAFPQEGKVALPAGGSRVIYYPVPYASIPNLSILDDHLDKESEELVVVEQAPDHFKVCNKGHFWACSGRWVARGVRPPPPAPPPAVLVPPASPAGQELPARPAAVDEKGAPAK
jgi:hypothetical protein